MPSCPVKYLLILFLAASLVLLCGNRAFSKDESLDDLIAKVQNLYDSIQDFRVSFIHNVPVKITGTTLTERGIFYYKKPKRMRWDYSEPPGKLLIVNPDFMWFYVPEDNRVYIQKTDTALKSQLAVKFLTGLGTLKDDFTMSFADPSPTDDKGNYFITLRPKEQTGGIQDLTLTIDRGNYYITGYRLTDMYGSKNSYFFQDITINNNPAEDLFHYDPPPGVKVETLP